MLQHQAYAACDDEVIREAVRKSYAHLVEHVRELSGADSERLDEFFRYGMWLNVAAAMGVEDLSAGCEWMRADAAGAPEPPPAPLSAREVALGGDPPARGHLAETLVELPGVGALLADVGGARALEGHRAGVVAQRPDRLKILAVSTISRAEIGELGPLLLHRAGAGRRAPGSASGATQDTASWARFHWQASCIMVRPWRWAIARIPSIRRRPAVTHSAGRKRRWSWAGSSSPGRRSSKNRPP